ncbi:hypothetical protein DUNSADRAFT_15486 [Dunaliella salina]|uniref:Uncharacterized protein n=1 Tax=Dunaliella salina TaxID=3046 RepID=A0ABQ7H1P6_DUNSA|nr:hypothetical protein DUNSADRAFT_15486 [Dunaliella salina]|eukprot:KAF5840776.1 hypothetical protein DUNSADRAFT_15486 [Dunaliella salina]
MGGVGARRAASHADSDGAAVTETQELLPLEVPEGANTTHHPDKPALAPAGRPTHGRSRSVAIFDPAGDASEALREAAEAKQGEGDAHRDGDPSKAGEPGNKASAQEGGGKADANKIAPAELKYTASARRKVFAKQKSRSGSRPSSVGYHVRGRTRVAHSLDARMLLEEGKGPPELPPPKAFLTLMEMKAVMQQGVMETPMYNGFVLKGSMPDRQQALHRQISNNFDGDNKAKRDLFKQRQGIQAKAQRGGGANQMIQRHAQLQAQQPDTQANSWTLALLTARWHAECIPRSQACLTKRLSLLRVSKMEEGRAVDFGRCQGDVRSTRLAVSLTKERKEARKNVWMVNE